MKQIHFSITALFALIISLFGEGRLSAQDLSRSVYGWVVQNESNPDDVGACTFSATDPSDFKLLHKHDFSVAAGAFAGKTYYCYTYRSIAGGAEPIAWGTYDFVEGRFTQLADYSQMTTLFYDMTYDYKSSTMYALGLDGDRSTLLRVDLSTGAAEKMAKLSKRYLTLTATTNGKLLCEDEYGVLCTVDADGTESDMDGGDYFPAITSQSATFNHYTQRFYWAATTSREYRWLEIDPTTGLVRQEYDYPESIQITGVDIPYNNIKEGAPNSVSHFRVEPGPNGTLHGKVSLTAPTATHGGSVLDKCDITLYRGDAEIKKWIGAAAGAELAYDDIVTTSGLYEYSVVASNAQGKGESSTITIYIGMDRPGAIQQLRLEKLSDKAVKITWFKPTIGANRGFLPNEVLYDVKRLPDGKVIATGLTQTEYLDQEVGQIGIYSYEVTPRNEQGVGVATTSESLVVGSAITLPYETAFPSKETALYTIINANGDKDQMGREITWKPLLNGGFECSYSQKSGDDWLITPPFFIEKGRRYKIDIEASAYSYEMPELMAVHVGAHPEVASMGACLADHVVGNDEGGRRHYYSYIAPREKSQDLHVGIHMHSAPDMFKLTVYRMVIREALEGTLHGIVSHGTTPIAGALISIEGVDAMTHSDESGVFTLSALPEGNYTIQIRAVGYKPLSQTIEISADKETKINFDMKPLSRISVSGTIKTTSDKMIPGAKILLRREEVDHSVHHVAYSDESGAFQISDIYEGDYTITCTRAGFATKQEQCSLTATSHYNIQLQQKAFAPRLVQAVEEEDGTLVSWQAPQHADTIRFYKGEGVARLGVQEYGSHSIVGTVYRREMALLSVSWMTDEFKGPHKSVDLVVFALDGDGEPTNKILFEKVNIPNTDNQWNRYELPKPMDLPQGALIALRYNGFLSLLADAGVQGGLSFERHVHVLCRDYTSAPFEYLDQHNMEKNYLLSIETAPLGADMKMQEPLYTPTRYEVSRIAPQDATETSVAMVDGNLFSGKDPSWRSLPMGYYQYQVKAVYEGGLRSNPARSQSLGKDRETTLTLHLTADASNAHLEDAKITLTPSDNPDGVVSLEGMTSDLRTLQLPKGIYSLTALLDGFDPIHQRLDLSTSNTYEQTLLFVERKLPAYNLKALKTGIPFQRKVVWNEDKFIFDGMENAPTFSTSLATGGQEWTMLDLDDNMTAEFESVTFPHMGEKMAFITFNPSETEPAILPFEPRSAPYAGRQYLAAFTSRKITGKELTHNVLISPPLKYDTDFVFQFAGRSFLNTPGKNFYRVGYATHPIGQDLAGIVWLNDSEVLPDDKWEVFKFVVPEKAQYVILQHAAEPGYFAMFDNLFIGEPSPYADGTVSKPARDRALYTLYLDNKIVAKDLKEPSYTLSNIPVGMHQLSVVAVYGGVETERIVITIEVSQEDALTEVSSEHEILVYPNPTTGIVRIQGGSSEWQLRSLAGLILLSGVGDQVDLTALPEGVYLLQLTGERGEHTARIVKQ